MRGVYVAISYFVNYTQRAETQGVESHHHTLNTDTRTLKAAE